MKVSTDRHWLVVIISHLLADALSINVFQNELATLYSAFLRNLASPLVPLRVQYHDYADWQRAQLDLEHVRKFAEKWEFHFRTFSEFSLLNLPFARRPLPDCDLSADTVSLQIDAECRRVLTSFALDRHATFYMVLVTAFSLLLHLYTRDERVALMVHFANRKHPDAQQLIGWIANSFMVGVTVSTECTILSLVLQVRQILLEIEADQAVPLPSSALALSQLLGAKGEQLAAPPKPPMDKVSFELLPAESTTNSELKITRVLPPSDLSEWGLRIIASENGSGMTLRAVYSTAMFDRNDVSRLLSDFVELLKRIPTSQNIPVSKLRLSAAVH
jgi:hypothetical protein